MQTPTGDPFGDPLGGPPPRRVSGGLGFIADEFVCQFVISTRKKQFGKV